MVARASRSGSKPDAHAFRELGPGASIRARSRCCSRPNGHSGLTQDHEGGAGPDGERDYR
jgi:hypothetical protein